MANPLFQRRAEATAGGVATDRLRSLVERIERLEAEKRALAGDIKDIFAEAKSAGFDTKALRSVIARRKKAREEREEEDNLRDLYERALDGVGTIDDGEPEDEL